MWWCSDTQRYTHTHTNPCRMITASFDFPRGFCFNKFIVNSKMELIQTRAEQHLWGHTQPRSGSFLLVTYGTARGEVKGTEAGRLCQHGSGPLLKCCLQQARKNLQCSLFNTSFSTGSRVMDEMETRDGRHDTQTMRWKKTKGRSSAGLLSSLLVSCSFVTF